MIHATRFPLLVRERHPLVLDERLLERARGELIGDAGDTSFGYLLGLEADPTTHPACVELSELLRERLLAGSGLSLSFLKLGVGAQPAASQGPLFEGPHLDSHPGLTPSLELLRVLVNLSRCPRRFVYAETDRWQLDGLGVRYGRSDFVPLELPEHVPLRTVTLPGREPAGLHAFWFLASAVPHVGLNDQPEQFLASFEALCDPAAAPLA